jgi:hypothetical protein
VVVWFIGVVQGYRMSKEGAKVLSNGRGRRVWEVEGRARGEQVGRKTLLWVSMIDSCGRGVGVGVW